MEGEREREEYCKEKHKHIEELAKTHNVRRERGRDKERERERERKRERERETGSERGVL